MIGDTRSLWLVCKPMFVSPTFNTRCLAVGNRHDLGCDADHDQEQTCKQQIFINGSSAVMRHTNAEESIRIRAILRSWATTGWLNDPWLRKRLPVSKLAQEHPMLRKA